MNRQQKIAIIVLIVSLLGLFLGITLTLLKHYVPGFPKGTVAFGGFILSIGVLLIMSRILKKKKGEVVSDERDELIEKNAYLAGFGAVYLLVIVVSYLPIGIAPEAKIPTQWFPFLFPIAVLCQCLAMSISTLIQYGLGPKGEKS
jgi:membrane protease YdiL (CAAX protease family)